MNRWRLVLTEAIEVPFRSSGNTVVVHPITYHVFRDGTMYKAVPNCTEEQKRTANLKDEVIFIFRPDKAVSTSGILDSNQHIVEQIGKLLRSKGLED